MQFFVVTLFDVNYSVTRVSPIGKDGRTVFT